MKARLEDAEPHVHSLQSSVAEGHTNSGKVGPQARSVTPAKKRMTKDTHEDKAQDSASIQLEKPDESTMNQAIASSLRDSASLQPDSLLLMPIQPGGVMIPSGSQDQRPNDNDPSHGKSSHSPTADCDEGCPEMPNVTRDPLGPGVTDQAGKTIRLAQVESTVSTRISRQVQTVLPRQNPPISQRKVRTTRRPATPPAPVPDKRRGKGLPQGQEAARAQGGRNGASGNFD